MHDQPSRLLSIRSGISCLSVIATLLSLSASGHGAGLDPTRRQEATGLAGTGPTLAESAALSQVGLEDENPFAPASPGDSDIGQQLILKEVPKNRWFRAYADAFAYWTNNAANTASGEVSDWFWGGRIGAGYQPRIASRWFLDFDLSQQLYRYDQYEVLDFESLEATASVIYIEPRLSNLLFFAGIHFNRITNDDWSGDLVNSFSIRAGVQKIFLINRRHSIHVSLMGDWDVSTDLDVIDRHEYIGDIAWRLKIMRDLILTTSYRFTWFDYKQIDRADALSLAGVSLSWMPRKWLELYLSSTFSFNQSDIDFYDYESTSLGGGVGVKIRF